MGTIKLIIKDVYGNRLFYPHCEKSELFAKLTKSKTLMKKDIETIKDLGYEIEYYIKLGNDVIKASL